MNASTDTRHLLRALHATRTVAEHGRVVQAGGTILRATGLRARIGQQCRVFDAAAQAFLALKEEGGENFEIVAPSLSILAEPPVSVVDANVDKKGTRQVAEAYLNYLYSEQGQRIAAKHFYRPRNQAIAAEFAQQFPQLKLVTIDGDFGGWKTAQPKFFNDGGVFDQIYTSN